MGNQSSDLFELHCFWVHSLLGFPGGSDGKESACNAEVLGRFPGERNGWLPTLYSCLENSIDRGDWWATVHEILQAIILEWVAFPSPGDLHNPGIEPRYPAMQADSLPAELQGKPKNTGMDSLSLLQQIFLTQELKWGLLHCRHILYKLSYQRSPSSPRKPPISSDLN